MPALAWFLFLVCVALASFFGSFDYANLANLLHPGFQGVRWARDQPLPGTFPTPLLSQVKGPKNEVVWEYFIPGASLES